MIKKLRNIRNHRHNSTKVLTSSITFSKTEPYALCHYLYIMFSSISNKEVISDYQDAIKLFIECASILNLKEKLSILLKDEVDLLEIQNRLIPITGDATPFMVCDNSETLYCYEQDEKIDQFMCLYEQVDEIIIDLYRILFTKDEPVFSAIIYSTLFNKENDFSLSYNPKLTKKQKALVLDYSKTKFLQNQVNLSDAEARYILFCCRTNSIDLLRNVFSNASVNDSSLGEMIGISGKEFRNMLRIDGKIKSYGFLDKEGNLEASIIDCIEDQSIDPFFNGLITCVDCSNAYNLDSYSINKDILELSSDLLSSKNPVSLLFYGKPGSGKTELAKSLCKLSGKKAYIFKNIAETGTRNVLGGLTCLLSMDRQDSILIIDEADNILKSLDYSFFGVVPTKNKGTINKMMEDNKNKVIYIINHHHLIDESTLRRFTFSIKFESMSSSMLRSIAKNKIEPLPITDETKSQLLDLLDKYKLSGSSAENIVKAIESISWSDEKNLLAKAQLVMKENSRLLYSKTKMRNSVKAEYNPNILNTSMDPLKIIEMVKNAQKFSEMNKSSENGIRMLFYGLSGTGKTELARYISEKLGKPILLKRASDIFGKYVGENEQNIKSAFSEAESSDSILLFDEADSFFSDRSNAKQSWERSTVNEFLTQMEEFTGILICTTNLRSIMDPALQRRFHILVEFKPMNYEGFKLISQNYFPSYHFSEKDFKKLEEYNSVTPGDFGSLSSRIRFMNPEEITSEYIMEELLKLQKEKNKTQSPEIDYNRKIGFTA